MNRNKKHVSRYIVIILSVGVLGSFFHQVVLKGVNFGIFILTVVIVCPLIALVFYLSYQASLRRKQRGKGGRSPHSTKSN